PIFNLNLQQVSQSWGCDNPALEQGGMNVVNTLMLEAATYSGNKITGEEIQFDDDYFDFAVSNLLKGGASVSTSEYWELTSTSPYVEALDAQYYDYFLDNVPLTNTYTAIVNWNGNSAGKVVFTLDSLTETVQTADAEVSADFELGDVSAGTHQLEALPYDDQGEPSVPMSMDVFIVPLEPWAEAANFAISGQDAPFGVTYTGEAKLPQEPIKLPYLDLSSIPFVGGRWGVPPIQLDGILHATSMGGRGEEGDVDGDIALYLGGNTAEAKLEIEGHTFTEMFADRLEFAEGEVEFNLAPYVIERQTGLVTLFPGAAEVFELKVIGPLLQAVNSIASVTASITTSATGQGTLAVNNNNTDLTITKGEIEPHIDIKAIAEMNIFNLARSWFGGGGSGDFTIEIAPNPGIRDCTFSMAMEAGVVLQPFLDKNYKDNWEMYTCPQTAQLVRKPYSTLLPYTSVPLPPVQTFPQERLVNEPFAGEDFEETVLVEDALWDASPVLAVGPKGRKALVWVSADASESMSTSAEIRARLNDGTDWGSGIDLTDNAAFDYSPAAAYDEKGNLVVAWLHHSGAQAAELTEEFVQGFEIAYAILDGSSGEILENGTLTENEEMDFDPQLVADNQGGVWAFGQASPGATLTGTPDSPNHLMARHWNGSKWTDADLVTDELVGSLSLNVATDPDGGYAVIFDQDTDGDLETGTDREIALITGDKRSASSIHYLTENEVVDSAPLVACAPDGNLAVAWYSAGEIVGWWGDIYADTETFIAAADLPAVLVDGLLVAGEDKQLALLWEGMAGDTPDILLSQLDPESGTWSQPEAVFANDLAGRLAVRRLRCQW
ncbi:MAG: hypothetical protein JXB38_06025, partial [Anaerolineales bacterium]|nr:hypothetical protein [Anaerolineales bacterium]